MNSVIIGGQKAGLSIESAESAQAFLDGTSLFKNNYLHALQNVFQSGGDVAIAGFDSLKMKQISLTSGSKVITDPATLKLKDPFNNAVPDVVPQSGSPLLSGAAFEGHFNSATFEKVAFIGAFGVENWTSGWTVWNK